MWYHTPGLEGMLYLSHTGRYSGSRITLPAAPSHPCRQWHRQPSSPITAAAPRRNSTVFPHGSFEPPVAEAILARCAVTVNSPSWRVHAQLCPPTAYEYLTVFFSPSYIGFTVSVLGRALGTPVRIRDCPAAVNRNDRRHEALARRQGREATASRKAARQRL